MQDAGARKRRPQRYSAHAKLCCLPLSLTHPAAHISSRFSTAALSCLFPEEKSLLMPSNTRKDGHKAMLQHMSQ